MKKRRVIRKKNKRGYYGIFIIFSIGILALVIFGGVWKNQKRESYPEKNNLDVIEIEKNETQGYAISSSNTEASRVGAKILEDGGNAVDAAVAMAYTLAVTEPYGSGLGGGGCMVIYDPQNQQYHFYNYGSEAPVSGNSKTILVPGFVSGMEKIRSDLGTKSMNELLQPAITYCDGFTVNDELENRVNKASGALGEESVFFQKGEWIQTGDTLKQPELKETLEILAEEGAEAFYTGTIAVQIAAETNLTMEDLAYYQTIHTDAVVSEWMGYEIASAAPPYSGVTLIQMLKATEMLKIPATDEDAYLDILHTATVISHAERAKKIYDLRFANQTVDYQQYVTDDYMKEILDLDIEDYDIDEESEDTTGFTVIDKNGMIVACTNTLSSFFGSKLSVAGFYLNNTGVNFGTGVNAYEGGKRPRTHISPTILRSKDEVLAIASPGGNAIIKILVPALIDICEFKKDAQETIDKRRVVFKTKDMIYYEIGYDTELITEVTGKGYTAIPVSNHSYFGNIALSGYNTQEGFYAVKDIRRNGEYRVTN